MALTLAAALTVLLAGPAQASDSGGFPTIAHRGYWASTTENSLPAVDAAAAVGAQATETDVRLTRDGYMVLMHSPRLGPTTHCTGYVHRSTKRKVRSYACRLDNGNRVPFARGLLIRARDRGLKVVMEVKSDRDKGRWLQSKLAELRAVVVNVGMADRVWVNTFDVDVALKARSLGFTGGLLGGLVTDCPTPATAAAAGDVVFLYPTCVDATAVAAYDAVGVRVSMWGGPEGTSVWQSAYDAGVRSFMAKDVPALVQFAQGKGLQ